MDLSTLNSDLLILILNWLPASEICAKATVCRRWARLVRPALRTRAYWMPILDSDMINFHKSLEVNRVKPWEYYFLLRSTFGEVELESSRILGPRLTLALAICSNQPQLIAPLILRLQFNSNTDLLFGELVEVCVLHSRKECFLSLLKHWPVIPDKIRRSPALIPVRFLSLFSLAERAFIARKIRVLPATALYLAQKWDQQNLQLEKLTVDQQSLAYDCFSEDNLDLLVNPKVRSWTFYHLRCREGIILRACNDHFRWQHPIHQTSDFFVDFVRSRNLNIVLIQCEPGWCLKHQPDVCQQLLGETQRDELTSEGNEVGL